MSDLTPTQEQEIKNRSAYRRRLPTTQTGSSNSCAWVDVDCDWPTRCYTPTNPDEQGHPFDAVLCPEHIVEAWMEHEAELQGDMMREDA